MSAPGDAKPVKDHVNRRGLLLGLLPLVLSIVAAGAFYYWNTTVRNAAHELRIGTEGPGSDVHELLEAAAILLRQKRPDLNVRFVMASEGSNTFSLIEEGKADIAAVNADAVTRPNLSLIASLFPDTYHLIVRATSGIESIKDLPGKRIAIPPETKSANQSFWFLVGQYGLLPERIRSLALPQKEALDAFKRGEVDALFLMRPPGNRRIRWLTDAISLRILPIDQADAMRLRRSALTPVTIPKGAYSGSPPVPDEDIPSVSSDQILVSHNGVADDIIRDTAQVLFDNRRELLLTTRLAGFITQPDLGASTILPIHPGARAFYDRDQPSFFQENAEPIGVVVSVTAILASLFLWLKRTWNERQKGRTDVYNLELVNLAERAQATTSATELSSMKDELFAMLSQVVRDLDEDRIDGKGFHFFAFTWEATLAAIRDSEARLGIVGEEPPARQAAIESVKKRRHAVA